MTKRLKKIHRKTSDVTKKLPSGIYLSEDKPSNSIQYVINTIVHYFINLVSLLYKPKSFIKSNLDRKNYQNALLFYLVSNIYGFIYMLLNNNEILKLNPFKFILLVILNLFMLMAILCSRVILISISWHLVGSRATINKFVITVSYYSGILLVLDALSNFVGLALLINGFFITKINENIFFIIKGLLLNGWILLGWGAYREFSKISKLRSGLAFIIYFIPATIFYELFRRLINSFVKLGFPWNY